MTNLTVGAGQQFSTLKAAIAASNDGDVLLIQPGTYLNDFATINTAITLKGVGGMVHARAETAPSDGKAIFTVNGDVTFENFEFSGAAVPDRNGAGIRHQGGDLTVLNSYFHDNQMGILTNNGADLTVTIRNSEFANNGIGNGQTHSLYANRIGRLEIENSYFHDLAIGHHIKSRAAETIVTDSVIADYDSSSSYSIDLPNGGKATLSGNFIHNGPNSDNFAMVSFGVEGNLHAGSGLTMQDNTVVNDVQWGVMLWNTTGIAADISDTSVWGMTASQLVNGLAKIAGTDILDARPAANGSSPWQWIVDTVTPPTPVEDPDEAIAKPAPEVVDIEDETPVDDSEEVTAEPLPGLVDIGDETPVDDSEEVTAEPLPGLVDIGDEAQVEDPDEVIAEPLPGLVDFGDEALVEDPDEVIAEPLPGLMDIEDETAVEDPDEVIAVPVPNEVDEAGPIAEPQPTAPNSSHWEWVLNHSSGNHGGWWNGMGNGRPHNFTRASETDNLTATATATSDDWFL
ncbi:hypothetical protein [Falsiroseomonas sp. E2-1-a20]|uniref:hypothetical protein n=1 Tax=Falsiroseomonas sp. E2-1-a20 TaxID=3239300 RepID=UPI003F3FB207